MHYFLFRTSFSLTLSLYPATTEAITTGNEKKMALRLIGNIKNKYNMEIHRRVKKHPMKYVFYHGAALATLFKKMRQKLIFHASRGLNWGLTTPVPVRHARHSKR
jgi:hypothetical protein